jgi:alkylation response protein AidB-like acyl-CoA dehydrogenase
MSSTAANGGRAGAGDPRCKVAIVMGKTDPQAETHKQQSMILVPLDAPGVTIERHLPVFGYDDAPARHMEIALDDVRVPPSNMLLGEGGASRSRRAGSGRGASTIACAPSARPRKRSTRWSSG